MPPVVQLRRSYDLPPILHPPVKVDRKMKPRRSNPTKHIRVIGIDSPHPVDRIQRLMKLAEDGRKRSSNLPPLETEPSFYRSPKKGAISSSFSDEHSEGAKRYKKISVEVDRQIVNHLRRDLAKRLEKRLATEYSSTSGADSDGDGDSEDNGHRSRRQSHHDHKPSLFSKYSETGDKIVPNDRQPKASATPSPSRRKSHGKSRTSVGGFHWINGQSTAAPAPDRPDGCRNDSVFIKASPLPNIQKDVPGADSHPESAKEKRTVSVTSPPAVSDVSPVPHSGIGEGVVPNDGSQENGDDTKVDQDTGEESHPSTIPSQQTDDEETTEPQVSFRSFTISPVPTPSMQRPETRETARVSRVDSVTQVLNGYIHRRCPPDNKVIQIYVLGGFSDTITERTVLMEHVYPSLRSFCHFYGHDLRIIDLHWGIKDTVCDDHSLPEFLKRVLARCQENSLGVNLLIIMGERYGPVALPAEIPAEEFESVMLACRTYRERQFRFIRQSIADIEATRAERERLRRLASDAGITTVEPTATTTQETVTTNENAELPRNESTNSQKEDKDEEMEPTVEVNSPDVQRKENKKDQAAIRALRESEDDLPDISSLETWYRLDENCIPPVYRLQNISMEFKDILKNDGAKRDMAKLNWFSTSSRLLKVLHTFVPEVIKSHSQRKKYFSSVLEMELGQAMESEFVTSRTICIMRTFKEADNRVSDPAAEDFLDVVGVKQRSMDNTAAKRIDILRNEKIMRKLPHSSIGEFSIEWDAHGVRETGPRDHIVYLERMRKHVLETVKHHLSEAFDERGENSSILELFQEVAQHVQFCHEKVKKFHGRKDILTLIKSYLRFNSRLPLVLHGKTGSGKSAIISKAAKDTNRWFRGYDQDIRVLIRIIGATEDSRNVRTLLRTLCLQMCHIFGNSFQGVPTDYKGLVNDFGHRMKQATEDRPLVIFIDGVDGLADDHDGRKMAWLPRELPEHVHIVLSSMTDEKYESIPSLNKILAGKGDDCFVEVPELPPNDAAAIVMHWMNSGGRCLTQQQFDTLMAAFAKCPVPLFLKIAYNETLLWKSYSPPEMCKLADGVKKLATFRFGRLERDHGEPFVRRALGYVTAARHGLNSVEMEDLLSLDDVVMDEVTNIYRPPRRRLPPLLWVRLLEDLSDLLMEYWADNSKTLRWAHSPFHEAAVERYLDQRDKAPSYHKALAEYFLGMWYGKPKPYTGSEIGVDRLVSPQDLFLEPEDSPQDGSDRVYNLRKINELPYHLLNAQMADVLKSAVLLNFEWILAKLCGTSLRTLLEEYSIVIQAIPEDQELKILSETLHLSGGALLQEPRQLAAQLVGRLDGVVLRDTPRTPGDPRKYPNILKLVDQAKYSSLPALIPSVECLTPPGGVLFDLLSGHTDEITAVTLTLDGMRAVTSSLDDTIKLWDLRTGRVVKTLVSVGANVTSLRTAKNNTVLVTVEASAIRLWSMRTSACLLVVDDMPDPASVCVAQEGQILVALYEGTNTFRSWDMERFHQLCQVNSPGEQGVHKDHSILITPTVYNEQVLHAFRSGNTATVQHARNGRVLRTLTCNEKGSSIVAVAVSRDYHVVCCRQQYMQLHEMHVLELFDSKKGNYLRTVTGCVQDHVTELHVNLIGSHALAVCAWEKQQMSDIAIWNLETEDHKHLARHPLVATAAACLDFRFCLTAGKGQNSLRIWNLSSKINQPAPRLKKQLGIAEIMPMQDNPLYVVVRAVNHGPISIWNVAKSKCLQAAVRVERGLTETSDAVVIRNTRLVILTDRGFSSVSEDSRPVFQTVLIYDLKAKRYERKLTGCYIAPAPSHEYVLLDGERLMGPSDSRTHMVIWSLVSGHAVQRIKTNFKDLDRRKIDLSGTGLGDSMQAPTSRTPRVTCPKPHLTPWDQRAETNSARTRRLEGEAEMERQLIEEFRKEKENAIEQFIISGNEKILVASFYAHHMCVFDIESQKHIQTLENEHSLLLLHVGALTYDGTHLVHANYDEEDKVSYVTLWDCTTGMVKRRLKRETDVCALGINMDATRIVIGKAPNQLHIWDPMVSSSLRRARGYEGLRFSVGSKIFLQEDTSRAVVFAGDISIWDLDSGTVLAVFTPDTRVLCCQAVLSGRLIAFGLYERQELVVLKLSGHKVPPLTDAGGTELFGETTGDTTDEDEEEGEGEGGGDK